MNFRQTPWYNWRSGLSTMSLILILWVALLHLCVKSIQAFLNLGYVKMISLLKFCTLLALNILLKSWEKFLIHLRLTRLEWKKLTSCFKLSTTILSLIPFNFFCHLSLTPEKLQLYLTLFHLALKLLLHILS